MTPAGRRTSSPTFRSSRPAFAFRLLPIASAWVGLVTMAAGAVTAAIGILYALNERDIKRFLAYSTIENTGIIVTAFGAAMIFGAYHQRAMWAFLLLAGLYHVANHGTYKTLLFCEAGVVEHAVGMPRTRQAAEAAERGQPVAGPGLLAAACVALAVGPRWCCSPSPAPSAP